MTILRLFSCRSSFLISFRYFFLLFLHSVKIFDYFSVTKIMYLFLINGKYFQNMNTRWKKSNHSVYNCGFHLIWCPKYRRPVLVDGIDDRLKELLLEKSAEHNWQIEKMEVMPDHVHLFIKVTPTDAPSFVVSQLKGFSSFMLRKEFPSLKSRLPTLWTRSFYCESVGHISEKTVKKYIDDQKKV